MNFVEGTLIRFTPAYFEQPAIDYIKGFFGQSLNESDTYVVCETKTIGNIIGASVLRNIERSEVLYIEQVSMSNSENFWCFITEPEVFNYRLV